MLSLKLNKTRRICGLVTTGNCTDHGAHCGYESTARVGESGLLGDWLKTV